MKFALEASKGWVKERPEELLDALIRLAVTEGADPDDFRLQIAKAAGASKAHFHGTEESEWQILEDCVAEANTLYQTAMTVAVSEIIDLISDHFSKINVKNYRKQAGLDHGS